MYVAQPCVIDPRGLKATQNAYFSLLTPTKQLLLVTFCDTLAGIEVSFWTDGTGTTDGRTEGQTDGQTDVEVEIVIQMIKMTKSFYEF